jgi:hypothetical protein
MLAERSRPEQYNVMVKSILSDLERWLPLIAAAVHGLDGPRARIWKWTRGKKCLSRFHNGNNAGNRMSTWAADDLVLGGREISNFVANSSRRPFYSYHRGIHCISAAWWPSLERYHPNPKNQSCVEWSRHVFVSLETNMEDEWILIGF